MFDSIGWAEILVIVVAGLFILGPERLPEAAAWLGRSVRKVRDYATGAREQLRTEMGDDFEDLRKPLEDLQQLRNFDPRRAVTKHLFDDVDTPNGHTKANGHTPPAPASAKSEPAPPPGEKAPFDPDAT
ncbi:MAG: Sec-independent protein translocase protein TatB [Actinophytocola sp.]|uniref:Sec-independent protein translocase protein TatB n=1 Tax=Actinophytocola sp. TaxID=1872138 RepID=UPI003D6C2E52